MNGGSWLRLLSRTNPGPPVQTHPLIRCTPLRCGGTRWWLRRFLQVLSSWPPPAPAAPGPSSAGSLSARTHQNTPVRVRFHALVEWEGPSQSSAHFYWFKGEAAPVSGLFIQTEDQKGSAI